MPKIPEYGSGPTVDVAKTPFVPQHASATAEMLSIGARQEQALGAGLQRAGAEGFAVANDIQKRDNADQVFRALTATQDEYLGFDKAARERLGASAKDLTDDTVKWWDAALAKHGDSLGNETQRKLYTHQMASMRRSSLDTMSTHEGVQRHKSLSDSAKANTMSSINQAVANPYDETVRADSRAAIERNVGVEASLNGWTKDVYDYEKAARVSKLHEGIVGSMVDRDPNGAKAYYDANKGEIAGSQHAQIEKALDIGGIRERSQNYTTDILSKTTNQTEAVAKAQADLSGVEEDETVRRINEHYSQVRGAREAAQKDAGDAAWKAFDQGGLSAIPTSVLAGMDPREKQTMEDYARSRADHNEADIVTDYAKYSELMTMAATQPAEFLKENPNSWRTSMNTQDWNTLRGVYNQVLTAQGKPPPNLMTANGIADGFLNQAGLTGEPNKQAAGYVKAELMNAMAAVQSAQPDKHLTDAQLTLAADARYKAMVDNSDPRLTVRAKPEALVLQNRTVAQYAANVLEKGNSAVKGRALTAQQNEFKTIADEVLEAKRQKTGGTLSQDATRRTLDFLMRKGKIKGSGYIRDDRGYYFEFLSRDDVGNFEPDEN